VVVVLLAEDSVTCRSPLLDAGRRGRADADATGLIAE
jgi:hypothetical protein